jgi:hypothetical protein
MSSSDLMNRWHVVKVPTSGVVRQEAHFVAREDGPHALACGIVAPLLRPFDAVRDLGEVFLCEDCKAAIRATVARVRGVPAISETRPIEDAEIEP